MKISVVIWVYILFFHFALSGQNAGGSISPQTIDSIPFFMESAQYEKALNFAQERLRVQLEKYGPRDTLVAEAYYVKGDVYLQMGTYDRALDRYRRAVEIWKTQLTYRRLSAEAGYKMGFIFRRQGQYVKALECLEKVLAIQIEVLGEGSTEVADTYTELGILLYHQAKYEASLDRFRQALAIWSAMDDRQSLEVVNCYTNIGNIYWAKHDFEKALDYYQSALNVQLAVLTARDPVVAVSYNNVGLIYYEREKYEKALEYHQKALDLRLSVLGERHAETARSYENLSAVYQKTGREETALSLSQKALAIRLESLGEKHPSVTRSYLQIGRLYLAKGEWYPALDLFEKALAIQLASLAEGHPEIASTYKLIGEVYERKKDYIQAITHYEKSLASLDLMRESYTSRETKEIHLADNYALFGNAIRAAEKAHEARPDEFDLEKAFIYSEKGKGNLLLEALHTIRAESYAGVPDSLLAEERDLRITLLRYDKGRFEYDDQVKTADDGLANPYHGKIANLKQRYARLIDRFEKDYPEYYRLKYETGVMSVAEVQNLLLKDQALIEYFVADSAIYVFVIDAKTFRFETIKKDFPLAQWTSNLRKGLLNYHRSSQKTEALYDECNALLVENACRLYDKLIRPLGSLPEKLIIVPDDVLWYIPFEILMEEKPEENHYFQTHAYLLRQHQISYNFSATLWKEMLEKQNQSKGTLIFAPDFPASGASLAHLELPFRGKLSPLKFNKLEAEAVGGLTNGKMLDGSAANLRNFQSQAARTSVLHLATHAILNDRHPDYSFLAFASNKDSVSYDKFFVRDLYDMRLPLDMAVLSACETGMGELQRGEGMISLARGFAYAGAKSIVTSLWPANDRSTAEVMELFYKNLRKGWSKEEALQKAKLTYLDAGRDPLEAHPFYWAAFVGTGDMQGLDWERDQYMVWITGGVFLLLLGWGIKALAHQFFWRN